MEKEKEWTKSEEEDEEITEEVNGSLERRKKKGSIEAVNGEKHSVYFDADEGTDFNKDKDFPRLGEHNEIFVPESNIQDGNASIEANDLITHNAIDAKENNNHELRNLVLNSHSVPAINNGNKSTRNEDEIHECTEPKPEVQTRLIAEDYDIEKIIEEQETHDLYCPNCHSCITKRVILRKRKRTRENKNDLRPEKLPHVSEITPASVEVVDQEDKEVFRCLSCFSFFIPTEGSFNVFRFFGKKDGSRNSRISEKTPTEIENQVPLLSGSSSTKNNDNKAGVPLFAEENNVMSSRDPSSHLNDNSSSMPTVGAMNLGANENKNGINDSVMKDSNSGRGQMGNQDEKNEPSYSAATMLPDRSTAESYSNGVLMNNSAQQIKPTYASIVSEVMKDSNSGHGQMGNQDKKNEPSYSAATMLPDRSTAESYSNGVLMNNSAQQIKPTYASIVSEDRSTAESYCNGVLMNNSAQQIKPIYASIVTKDPSAEKPTFDGALMDNMKQVDKHSFLHMIVQNKMLDTSVGVSNPTGGSKGTENQGDKTWYPVQAISEDPSTGAPRTNGMLIGTADGNPSNLASIMSDGIYTSNTNLNGSVLAVTGYISSGNDVTKPVNIMQSVTPMWATTENNQINYGSDATSAVDTVIDMGTVEMLSSSRAYEWDILKSIVYGGLIESILSLTLVASAAGAGSSTINICALGLANLVGGLFLLSHNLSELRIRHDAETNNQIGQQPSEYWEKLGKREHAKRHIFISVLSFIIFGALPPIVYAFTFRKSRHKEHKIIAMATSSLFCVALLAAGKAHVKSRNGYLKSVFYYLGIALPASGLSYVAGVMIDRLFVELPLFDPTINSPSPHLLSSY